MQRIVDIIQKTNFTNMILAITLKFLAFNTKERVKYEMIIY